MQGYSELRPKDGWPSWLDSFLEAGFRPNPQQDWMVVKCGKSNFLLSSANSEWANAYSKINDDNAKFGYNVSEDRWSYGREPDGAEILTNAIRQMSDGRP